MEKYGRLKPINFSHRDKHNNHYWHYKCDCGNRCIKRKGDVRFGKIKSCGCLTFVHGGASKNSQTQRPYRIWRHMMHRCYKKYEASYKNYGARGITVCERWHKFDNFWEDMKDGYKPKLTLDRIDNDGNYEPGNCRWASTKEQAHNKSSNRIITHNGMSMNVTQWAEYLGMNPSTLFSRLDYLGWEEARALETAVK